MPVTDVTHDLDARTLTITAQFAATPERLWQVYADADQLAQIWGPPTHPATVVEHELRPGGRVHYFMTSPEGEKYYGFWRVQEVDEPRFFRFEDGFADENFEPADMPVSQNVFTFEAHDDGTRLVAVSTYESAEALQQVLDMGVVEGASGAMSQIDDLLAA